jgi:2-methylcitrate dehydratase PrpD
MNKTISEQLADFSFDLNLTEVPPEIKLRAKHLILDAIGVWNCSKGRRVRETIL